MRLVIPLGCIAIMLIAVLPASASSYTSWDTQTQPSTQVDWSTTLNFAQFDLGP